MKTPAENISFLKRFMYSPSTVGSFFPSSKRLAHDLLKRSAGDSSRPLRYLEVGAGSGALTSTIIQKMKREDYLNVVEVDPKFCELLRKKFGHFPNVAIHEISILDFSEDNYDCVISSLPLNTFPSTLVDQIFTKYKSLVKKNGHLSYFEYRWLEKIKCAYLSGGSLLDFRETIELKNRFLDQYCVQVDKTWLNFPPAKVFHCKM